MGGFANCCQQQMNTRTEQSNFGFLFALMGTGIGAAPDADGWHNYLDNPAPPNALCQFRRHEDPSLGNGWTGYSRDFSPYFNVAKLKWRYTGIAKQERGL